MPDLPHLAARLFGRPQCVSRAKLDLVLPLIVPRFLGQERRVPRAENPAQPTQPTVTVPGRIAIVPVFGTLVARGAGMVAESGQTSYEGLSALLSRQVARAEVAGILLDIDSGGGEFAGLPEFADEVAAANRQKPVWAIVRPAAFSAAYWIASQAERIVATPSSELGSIGVMAVHVDASARDEKEGYRLTFFSAGTHKLDGHPHLPLQPAFAETIQAAVDEAYDLFVAQVARGRAGAMTETEVRATEARVYSAAEGLALGLADQVGTFADAVSAFADRLASGNPPRRGKAARNRKESAMTDTNKPADPATLPAAARARPRPWPTWPRSTRSARSRASRRRPPASSPRARPPPRSARRC